MFIRIAQCLCPARHAIMALMFTDTETSDENAIVLLREAVRLGLAGETQVLRLPIKKINPWCGICGKPSDTWTFEVGRSKDFDTAEEAEKMILEAQTAQAVSRMLLDHLGVTYDSHRKANLN